MHESMSQTSKFNIENRNLLFQQEHDVLILDAKSAHRLNNSAYIQYHQLIQ